MNLHEIYIASQLAKTQILGNIGDNLPSNVVVCSQSEFAEIDTNNYPIGTIFMIWSDSE